MIEQLKTIREALTLSTDGPIIGRDDMVQEALAALAQIEAAVGEPVHQFRKDWCSDWYDGKADHSDGGGPYEERTLYAAPVAQQHETVTNDEQARAYMDARLWEFIDMAGMWPKAKPDPRIWAHVMVYAPVAQQPQEIEVQCPVCNHKFHEWPNDKQPQAEVAEVFHCKTCGCAMQMPHDDCLACERGETQQAEAVPNVCASFYTESAELIGTTEAPIKRVEREDDGTLHVYIDHWPQQAEAVPSDVVRDAERYRHLRSHCLCAGHGSITVFLDDRGGSGNRAMPLHLEALDAAIDAAMAQGANHG